MRTIKELLELMLQKQEWFESGLCYWVQKLYYDKHITFKESEILEDYIKNNRPSIFSSIDAFKHYKDQFFWKKRVIKPRLKWINKHIEKLSIAEIVKLP